MLRGTSAENRGRCSGRIVRPHLFGEAEELGVFFRGQRNLKDISSVAEP